PGDREQRRGRGARRVPDEHRPQLGGGPGEDRGEHERPVPAAQAALTRSAPAAGTSTVSAPSALRMTAIPTVASAVRAASVYVARSIVRQPAPARTAAALASTVAAHRACGAMPTSVAVVWTPANSRSQPKPGRSSRRAVAATRARTHV